jgi:hypothetical protein
MLLSGEIHLTAQQPADVLLPSNRRNGQSAKLVFWSSLTLEPVL